MTKTLPAPIRSEVKYEMFGHAYRIWGGAGFEFGDLNELHYIMLRGIDAPSEDDPLFVKARSKLNAIISQKKLRIKVVGRDEMMREEADVFVVDQASTAEKEELNVGLRMIQLGFGWHNGDEFEGAEPLRQAQQEAQEKKLGVWAQSSTLPPGEL